MKKLYSINLEGCDDETIFEMWLTEEQKTFVDRLAKKSCETSTYGCMPTMNISEIKGEQNGNI